MAKSNKSLPRTKVHTDKPAEVAGDRIERPHGGKSTKQVGPRTGPEKEGLRGPNGPGGDHKAVGPSDITKPQSGRGQHVAVGGDNWEDKTARVGGVTQAPGVRQPGSVKQIGPSDIGYQRLTEGRRTVMVSKLRLFAPKLGHRLDKGVPILKSGVGRAHAWSLFAGAPGSKKGGITGVGVSSTGDTILISGRKYAFGPEPLEEELVEPEASIVPGGGTDLYKETKDRLKEEQEEAEEEEE